MTRTITSLLHKRSAPQAAPGAALRSLGVKLTLAFALVGISGALLVALIVGQQTRAEFDRFLSTRDQTTLVDALGQFYASAGSWNGVGGLLAGNPTLENYARGLALTDTAGAVVRPNRDYLAGQVVPRETLARSVPIAVNGQTVGYVLGATLGLTPQTPPGARRRPPPETLFLQQVGWAAAASAGIAALLALAVGVLLARTLTRPLRELTVATEAMARGALGQQVPVRSRDEVGQLAIAFNQMNADLARSSQLRKQMTADLAHDLRTPLTVLRGYTEGLQDGRLTGAPPLFAVMHGEVEHLQRLVEDLRVLSLADAGELPLNRRAVDPAALLERAGLAYMVQAEGQGLTLRVDSAPDLPSIAVDTDRMAQVLNNLVSNALRYTARGGITLSADADERAVRLRVQDTGNGIAPTDLPNVFDRFYRADASRQRATGGSGLGLAIAKAIVEAHGGTIAAASIVGEGTTFTIALPVGALQRT